MSSFTVCLAAILFGFLKYYLIWNITFKTFTFLSAAIPLVLSIIFLVLIAIDNRKNFKRSKG